MPIIQIAEPIQSISIPYPHLAGLAHTHQSAADLCAGFPYVSKFSPSRDGTLYREYFLQNAESGAYATCLAYIVQASRGSPLKYYDGKNLITLGFGRDGTEVVAIAPRGPTVVSKLEALATVLKQHGYDLFVKKIAPQDVQEFTRRGFRSVQFSAKSFAHGLPDDVFSEVIVNIKKFEILGSGRLTRRLRQKVNGILSVPEEGDRKRMMEIKQQLKTLRKIMDGNSSPESAPCPSGCSEEDHLQLQTLVSLALGITQPPSRFTPGQTSHPVNTSYSRSPTFTHEYSPQLKQPIHFGWYQFRDIDRYQRGGLKLDRSGVPGDISMAGEILEFVDQWCTERSERTGESKIDLFDSYNCFFTEREALQDCILLLAREPSRKIVGSLLLDRGPRDTVSVVKNLADLRVHNLAAALIVQALESLAISPLISMGGVSDICFFNLGGSEKDLLHRAKRQYQPCEERRAEYMVSSNVAAGRLITHD